MPSEKKKVKKSKSSDDKKKSKKGSKGKKSSSPKKDSKKKPLLQDVELEHPVFKASGWEEVEVHEAPNHKFAITGNEGAPGN